MSSEKKKLPYFSDVTLFKRVDKYLDDNIDKQMIDKEAMVDELRNTYKEYHRRNKSAFRTAVYKAYNMINQNILEVTQDKSNEGSDVEAIEDSSTIEGDRPVGEGTSSPAVSYLQGLTSMASSVIMRPSKSSNNELINISSDEGDDEPPSKRLAVPPLYPSKMQELRVSRSNVLDHNVRRPPYEKGLRNVESQSSCGPGREEQRHKKLKPRLPAVSIFKPEKKKYLPESIPEVNFSDFGGYPKVIQAVGDIILHFCQSGIYDFLGVTPPRGLILHGPPGCGKTLLAHAVAGELSFPLVKVSGPELIGGISGESEGRIRKIFQQARQQVPCILFIDEIDVISQTRENARKDMERRIVSQLISCLDALSDSEEGDELLVIGATNRVEELDPGLRRAGRFDKEVSIGIPDRSSREEILSVLCRNLRLSPDVSIKKIAELTPGYVAADLKSLLSDSAVYAVKRISAMKKGLGKSQFAHKAVPTIVNSIPIKITDDNASDSGTIVDDEDLSSQAPGVQSPIDKELTALNDLGTSEDNGLSKDTDDNSTNDETNDKNSKTADSSVDMNVDENSASNGKSVEDEMEVVENGVGDDEQRSEDMEAVIIIDDNKCNREKQSHSLNGPGCNQDGLNINIDTSDILKALKSCQPSAKREGFATVPDVTWDDIGSLKDVRNELKLSIMLPVKYPDEFARMGINAPSGILLWGPPGCGKTLLAKAVANEANINFISVKGPELLNMYVGESEKAVRTCFARARNSQPCVIFFDEIDALCPRRSSSSEGSVSSRVVNQVLTEMDGVEGRQGVFLMAATNRPDMVDPAILRPGRLDKIVRVDLPDAKDREDILIAITKNGTKPPLDKNVSLEKIANCPNSNGFSGADLAALVKEASVIALTEHLNRREEGGNQSTDFDTNQLCVHEKHFDAALEKIKPSVLGEEKKRYEMMEKSFSTPDF